LANLIGSNNRSEDCRIITNTEVHKAKNTQGKIKSMTRS